MNKLEETFAKAFVNSGGSAKEMREINARIAAKIALELAKTAYNAGCSDGALLGTNEWEDFKKEIL